MEATLTLDINTDHLVDELAQRDPHLFQELHYDRHAIKQAVETLLRMIMLHMVPAEPDPQHHALPDESHDISQESVPPDSCIWLP